MAGIRGIVILVIITLAQAQIDSPLPVDKRESAEKEPAKPIFPNLVLPETENPYVTNKGSESEQIGQQQQQPVPFGQPLAGCGLSQTQFPQQRQFQPQPQGPQQRQFQPQPQGPQQRQFQPQPQGQQRRQFQPQPQQYPQPPYNPYLNQQQPQAFGPQQYQPAQPYPHLQQPFPQQYQEPQKQFQQPQHQFQQPQGPYTNYQPFAAPPPPPGPSRAERARALNIQPKGVEPDYSNRVSGPSQLSAGPAEKKPSLPYLTPPTLTFKVGIIADLGNDARDEDSGKFQSFLKEGQLFLEMSSDPEDPTKYNVSVEFNLEHEHHIIESGLNNKEEGFELSTLNVFNGKLYSCDDETGIIYELIRKEQNETTPKNETYLAQPWVILPNDGENTGFKCEWATVKNEELWVGSTGILVRKKDGKENEVDRTRQGVKVISPNGRVTHMDWGKNYDKITEAIGIEARKGFAVHEAVAWSELHQRWLFMPRRVSTEKYDKSEYHKKAGNAGIFVDDGFETLKTENFGNLTETAGFTSIKFIPGTQDQLILALKAGLDMDTNELYSTLEVFDLNGREVMAETKVATGIYAGVEFL